MCFPFCYLLSGVRTTHARSLGGVGVTVSAETQLLFTYLVPGLVSAEITPGSPLRRPARDIWLRHPPINYDPPEPTPDAVTPQVANAPPARITLPHVLVQSGRGRVSPVRLCVPQCYNDQQLGEDSCLQAWSSNLPSQL